MPDIILVLFIELVIRHGRSESSSPIDKRFFER